MQLASYLKVLVCIFQSSIPTRESATSTTLSQALPHHAAYKGNAPSALPWTSVVKRGFTQQELDIVLRYYMKGWLTIIAPGAVVKGGFTQQELDIVLRYYLRARSVMEWGMGTTTMLAARMGVPRLTGVDSSAEFISHLKMHGNISAHYRLVHADIGPLGEWGWPLRSCYGKTRTLWPFYSLGAISAEQSFDVYLVDGRFRVACACTAFLHGHHSSVVLVHDFFDRPQYHAVLSVAVLIEVLGNLAVLQRKPDADLGEIRRLWDEFRFEPA